MAATLQFNLGGADGLGGAHGDPVASPALNNIFDDVKAGEAEAGTTDYRALDVTNVGDAEAGSPEVFLAGALQNAEGTDYTDNTLSWGLAASPVDNTQSISTETDQPLDVTFAEHAGADSALGLPNIPVGSYARVWLQRTVTAGAVNDRNISATLVTDYA